MSWKFKRRKWHVLIAVAMVLLVSSLTLGAVVEATVESKIDIVGTVNSAENVAVVGIIEMTNDTGQEEVYCEKTAANQKAEENSVVAQMWAAHEIDLANGQIVWSEIWAMASVSKLPFSADVIVINRFTSEANESKTGLLSGLHDTQGTDAFDVMKIVTRPAFTLEQYVIDEANVHKKVADYHVAQWNALVLSQDAMTDCRHDMAHVRFLAAA